jgi:hypothetical protein
LFNCYLLISYYCRSFVQRMFCCLWMLLLRISANHETRLLNMLTSLPFPLADWIFMRLQVLIIMLFKKVQQIIVSLSCKNLIYYIGHFSLALQQWRCSYWLLVNEGAINALAGATVQYTYILLLGECWCCSSILLYCEATSSVIACKLRHISNGCLLLIISLPCFIQIFS